MRRALCVLVAAAAALAPARAGAQTPLTLRGDVIFFADDTEFRNPFREGDTLFGATVRAAALFDVTPRVRITLGAHGTLHFGDDGFEDVRPVVSLTIAGGRSSFTFGTLPLSRPTAPPGPDRAGLHGLVPPLQRETLAFEASHEAGFGWTFDGTRVDAEAWLNWQRLNTAAHRERFDTGVVARVRLARHVVLPVQAHVVHEGGQRFASGPVADSAAAGTGLHLEGSPGGLDRLGLELMGFGSRFVPDRGAPDRSENGGGVFARGSAERGGWRWHLLFWRGHDFITDQGDPNYLSVRRDGRVYRGVRDYSETGLTRTYRVADTVRLETSARLHRIEREYTWSVRVVGTAAIVERVR